MIEIPANEIQAVLLSVLEECGVSAPLAVTETLMRIDDSPGARGRILSALLQGNNRFFDPSRPITEEAISKSKLHAAIVGGAA